MTIEQLDITSSCKFEALHFEGNPTRFVTLDYVEHSPAHGYSDSDTSVDIDKEMAQKIVDFLCTHFDINRSLPLES